MAVTNTLAYYGTRIITAVKKFYGGGPRIKLAMKNRFIRGGFERVRPTSFQSKFSSKIFKQNSNPGTFWVRLG
jgi:hypothetical protein